MLIGRFLFLIPILAAAGSLAAKKKIPVTSGTFPTHGPLFVGLLVGTVVIIAVLTYFPAVSLGPIVEHYLMHSGKLFSIDCLAARELSHAHSYYTATSHAERAAAGRSHFAAAEEAGAGAAAVRSRDRQPRHPGLVREAEPGDAG